MPPRYAVPAVRIAIRTLLLADATLAGLIGSRIYQEDGVPVGSVLPYLTIGAETEIPWNTMGNREALKWGSDITEQVKATSTAPSYDQVDAIMERVKLLEGESLTVPGFNTAYVDTVEMQPPFLQDIANVRYRYLPAILRIKVHQQ